MYKKFSPEEMKEAEEGQSLNKFLNSRGYVVIKRTDIVRTFMNIIKGVPESKAEKETADFMKAHPVDPMLIMGILVLIERRLFKDCPEEE